MANHKGSGSDKIALPGNESALTNETANTMNSYFINITKLLNLNPHTTSDTMDIEQITSIFNNHVRIKKIRDASLEISSNNFEFTKVTEESLKNEVLKLNTKTPSKKGLYSSNNFETVCWNLSSFSLSKAINVAITEFEFPAKLKKSKVIILYIKRDPLREELPSR